MNNYRCANYLLSTRLPLLMLCFVIAACSMNDDTNIVTKSVNITASWQGDFPVAELARLPADMRDLATGYIANAETFLRVWPVFKPDQSAPKVDFTTQLVVFVRNIQFYNRNRIIKVTATDGTIEVIAMETLSALPITDKVAMSMAIIPAKGIHYIQVKDTRIKINK